MKQIAVFKSPSQIKFSIAVAPEDQQPMLSHTKRGVPFLREGAICMRVDVSAHRALQEISSKKAEETKHLLDDRLWIINLQTGRVFISQDMPVEWIKLNVSVEGRE